MAENVKKKYKVGKIYPRYSLEDAYNLISLLSKVGGNRLDNETLASTLRSTISSSVYLGKVSAAKQFKLLEEKKENNKKFVVLTELGKSILFPSNEDEKYKNLKDAFFNQSIYFELTKKYLGKNLPEFNYLGNIAINEFGISPSAKTNFIKSYIDSGIYANIFEKNGGNIIFCRNIIIPQTSPEANTNLIPHDPEHTPSVEDVAYSLKDIQVAFLITENMLENKEKYALKIKEFINELNSL